MKHICKATSLLALIALPFGAFAQSSPTDLSNFSPRAKLQFRYSLDNSYRKNAMDLITATARFGFNYKYKNVFGVLEAQAGSASSANTATSTNPPTDSGTQELFIVRRSNVGLEIYKSDPATVSFVIGRDRYSASIVYGPDSFTQVIGTQIDNMSSSYNEDGIGLRYAGKFEFGTITAATGYYNNVPVSVQNGGTTPFATSSIGQADNAFSSPTKTQSRAFLVNLGAEIPVADGTVEARAFYSSQTNAVTKTNSTAAAITSYNSRDTSNLEASVGYNYKAGELKGGLWYQAVTLGRTQVSSGSIATNDITYGNSTTTDDSYTMSVFGLGVVGNSKLFGLTNLLSDGDMLIYGLGYQMNSGQLYSGGGGSTGVTSFSNSSVNNTAYAVSVGYQQGQFALDLNYVGLNSDKEIYAGSDGVINKKDASLLYLVGTIVI